MTRLKNHFSAHLDRSRAERGGLIRGGVRALEGAISHRRRRDHVAVQERADQRRDLGVVRRRGEVAGLEEVKLDLGEIVEIGSRPVGGKGVVAS